MNIAVRQNCPIEMSFTALKDYRQPFHDVALEVVFTGPDGEEHTVPAFWAGEDQWKVRYASPLLGMHTFRTRCNHQEDDGLHGKEGSIEVLPYEGKNPLFRHGPLRVSANGKYLTHHDGTPFFWLGDCWWFALAERFGWPDDVRELTADRLSKGFTVIQLAAGLHCEVVGERIWSADTANEAGWAWEHGFTTVNPRFWDLADLRVAHLVHNGLVPCLAGAWGYYLRLAGVETMKKHWRYIIARYGAYPVVWCLAGEATMPAYDSLEPQEDAKLQREGWTEVAAYVRSLDPYQRPLSVHASPLSSKTKDARSELPDTALDYDMLHTGHNAKAPEQAIAVLAHSLRREPRIPSLEGEISFEGMHGGNAPLVQRFVFWTSMLGGACGFTYGANGIWQFNTEEVFFRGPERVVWAQYDGPLNWGEETWREAARYLGSSQVGRGRRILERYAWWELEPMHDSELENAGRAAPFAASVSDEVYLIYLPSQYMPEHLRGYVGRSFPLKPGTRYRAAFINPRRDEEILAGTAEAGKDGRWPLPGKPTMEDWLLVLEVEEDAYLTSCCHKTLEMQKGKDFMALTEIRPRRWQANWIFLGKTERNAYYYFRKEVQLEAAEGYKVFITADTRYRLYVNGHYVGHGPPQSMPHHYYYDSYELDPYFKRGVNCLAVIVYQAGNTPGAQGGLLLELLDADGNTMLASDETWRGTRAMAWREDTYAFRMSVYAPYQEFFDARKVPAGWTLAGFDDHAWQEVDCLRGPFSPRPPSVMPWSHLVPRDIPSMVEAPTLAQRIERVEESLDTMNRMRPDDLSIALSLCGQPLEHARVENVEVLLSSEGGTLIRNSTKHLDKAFDGVYNPSIVLDFGRSLNAFLELDLTGTYGGTVDIGYAERLTDGHFQNAIEGQFADRYTMTDGRQRFRPFTWKSFRYVKLLFRSCFEPVTLHNVQACTVNYPFEDRGAFESSDEQLSSIFDICRYTLRLCSNEAIMDTPWREQAQFVGDVAAVTLGGIYSCFGDTRLPAKFLRQSASNQLPTGFLANVTNAAVVPAHHDWRKVHPDYSLWWIHGLWQHYLYTGEEMWIQHYYPHVVKIIQSFLQYQGDSSLISDMPYAVFIDWANVDKRGECAALNALLYSTLELVGKMAEIKQDSYTVELVQQARRGIAANFQARLFDPARGCFADANLGEGLSPQVSEHANMAVVLWELCDSALAVSIIDAFYVQKSIAYIEAQPFFTKVVLQALDKFGRTELALALMRERWGKRMVDRGATSTYEEWGMHGSWRSGDYKAIMRTQSHAWSAYPAEFLIRALAGIEILEAGCRKVRVRPREVGFDYTSVFPTPLGEIRVAKRGDDVQVDAPEGVEVIT